jgi:hypothetical protein
MQCVTEAEAQVHVFVTSVQQVITQFVDVYVLKAVKAVQVIAHRVQDHFVVL